MKSNIFQELKRMFVRERVKTNLRIAVFGFFLAIASILWYLNKLNNEFTSDIDYPVRIVNMPKGKVVVGSIPESITIRITSFGYSLLRYRANARLSPITLDLNQLPLQPLDHTDTRFYLLTSRLVTSIYSQVRGDYRLESITPDSLYFEFAPLAQKRVPVVANLAVEFDRQYMQSAPIEITPDSITISGPKSIVDTIYSIPTLPLRIDRLSKSIQAAATLPQIPQVGFSHRKVTITIPVDKFTQASVNVPVVVRNLPDSLNLRLLPKVVVINCNVPLSQYQGLNAKKFRATVDYLDVNRNLGNRLRVRIEKQPEFISRLTFEPQYLDYIIEKR